MLHNGETKRVVQLLPRPGPEVVYNLEVHGEHVYQVTPDGVLVHNWYSGRNPPINRHRQVLHTNGTPGKSQFLNHLDADDLVQDTWRNGALIRDKNGKIIGKIKTYKHQVGTMPKQKSVKVHFSREKGIHGVPTSTIEPNF